VKFTEAFWFIASAIVVLVFIAGCIALAFVLMIKGEG
jgi:hypothetical protein